jgi:C-terminal peptidase prc
MSAIKYIACFTGILYLLLLSCKEEPVSPTIPEMITIHDTVRIRDTVIVHDTVTKCDIVDKYYSFAAQRLDQYLIYRDRLPSDLYAFSCPESLYSSIKDKYTIYYNVDNARDFRKSQTTLSSGFGIRFNIDSTNRGFPIKNVFAGSPAASAGLKDLDTLVAVKGIDVIGISYDSLKVILKSINIGVSTVLKVKRSAGLFEFTLSKGEYLAPTVFTDSLNTTTVHITITSFLPSTITEGGTAAEFSSAVNRSILAQNIILDLRGNGGGRISHCVDVASHFVPAGDTLVSVMCRNFFQGTNSYITENSAYLAYGNPDLLYKKIIILCDSNSASASEIVIAGLKSSRPDIKLIGTVTFGKGIGQSILLGPDSVQAKVTSQMFLRRDGTSYHGKGIVPDILTSSKDALNKAIEIINGSSLAKKGCVCPRYESPDELLAKPLNDVLIQETEIK